MKWTDFKPLGLRTQELVVLYHVICYNAFVRLANLTTSIDQLGAVFHQ